MSLGIGMRLAPGEAFSLHIAYYAPSWPPAGAANGIVTYVSTIRDHLLNSGHEVSILSWGKLHLGDGSERMLDVRPNRFPRLWNRLRSRVDLCLGHHPFAGRYLAQQFREAHRHAPFDLIEMEESFGWSQSVKRELEVPVVTRLHGPHFLKPEALQNLNGTQRAAQRASAEGRAIRRAIAISAPTRTVLQATCAHYGGVPPFSAVIPNPIRPQETKGRWTLPGCDPDLVLYVGRFDHLKGADTMIEAFGKVVAQRPSARLMMVGPDAGMQTSDGRTLDFAAYLAEFVGPEVRGKIDFKGLLPPDRIADLRRRAFLTVVASHLESFSYAVVEAMAVGSPLLSTNWAGSDELVDDGVTGWLTPVGAADEMARRICWIMARPETAACAGAAAWRRCRENYAPEAVGERMLRFYDDVRARHAAHR